VTTKDQALTETIVGSNGSTYVLCANVTTHNVLVLLNKVSCINIPILSNANVAAYENYLPKKDLIK